MLRLGVCRSESELESVIEPRHSGIVAVVSDPAAVELRQAIRMAESIVQTAIDDVVAKDVKAAAKEAEDDEEAAADAPGDARPVEWWQRPWRVGVCPFWSGFVGRADRGCSGWE